MAGGFRGERGGIRGLRELISGHSSAIEYDLIKLGLRLDDLGGRLSWRDLKVVVDHLPPESALAASVQRAASPWSRTDLLLGMLINQFEAYRWGKADPKKRGPFAPPIVLPGHEPESDRKQIRGAGVDRAKADEWLARLKARQAK